MNIAGCGKYIQHVYYFVVDQQHTGNCIQNTGSALPAAGSREPPAAGCPIGGLKPDSHL